MRVYPAAGLLCRDPVKKDLLPEEGREVDDNDLFWLRRIAQGDVVTKLPVTVRAVSAASLRSDSE